MNYQWKSKKRYTWHLFHPGISKTPTISNTKWGLLLACGHHQWVWPCSQTREQPRSHLDQVAVVQSNSDGGTARRAGNASNQAGGNGLEYEHAVHARNKWAAEGFKLGLVWAETPHAILGKKTSVAFECKRENKAESRTAFSKKSLSRPSRRLTNSMFKKSPRASEDRKNKQNAF